MSSGMSEWVSVIRNSEVEAKYLDENIRTSSEAFLLYHLVIDNKL